MATVSRNFNVAFRTVSGAPGTGLSPTIDIWRVGDGVQVVTGAAMTEVGGGWYRYTWGSFDTTQDYVALFTASGLPVSVRYGWSGTEAPDVVEIVDQNWDEALSGHTGGGSTGEAQNRLDEIDTGVNNVEAKLPTNYIMGSSVQSDKDDEIDDILTDTAAMQPIVSTNLDAAVSTRATQAQILNDATPFAGANIGAILADTAEMQGKLPTNNIMGSSVKTDKDDEIDAILADTAAVEPLVSANLDAQVSSRQSEANAASRAAADLAAHAQTQSDIGALNDLSIADVQTAMTNQGYTSGRAPNLDNLDAAISAVPAAVDATLTAAHGAGSWAAASASAIADAVLRELIADHSAVGGSLAEFVAVIRGLVQANFALDNTTYTNGLMTACRIRAFDSKANLPSSPGGSETTGLLSHLDITVTPKTGQPTQVEFYRSEEV